MNVRVEVQRGRQRRRLDVLRQRRRDVLADLLHTRVTLTLTHSNHLVLQRFGCLTREKSKFTLRIRWEPGKKGRTNVAEI